jgi:hypothetical protein
MGIVKAKIPKVPKIFLSPPCRGPPAYDPSIPYVHPVPLAGMGFSCLCSPFRHCRWFVFARYGLHLSTFLRPLTPRALPRFFATTDALTPVRPIQHRPLSGQVSLVHTAQPSTHSVTKHLTRPIIAFLLPAQRDGLPRSLRFRVTRGHSRGFGQPGASFRSRSGLRLESAGSSPRAAESCSPYGYGLHIRLRLLPTPPRGDAVTFGYQERASPGGGLSPPRLRLLPGARIPAFAGMTVTRKN